MKNLALSLTAEDIQRFVTKAEEVGYNVGVEGSYYVSICIRKYKLFGGI